MIYNGELEQSVLACMMLDEDASKEIEVLKQEDFVIEKHQIVYQTIKELVARKEKVDYLTIFEKSGKAVELSYLVSLANSLPGVSGFGSYVRQLKDLTNRRKLIQLADTMAMKAKNGESDTVEFAEKMIFGIREQVTQEDFTMPKDLILGICNEIEERIKSDRSISGLDTGFEDVNRMTDGLQKSDVIVVAARPSMGKTSFALNICQNAAVRENTVAVFSLEMSKEALVKRMLLSEALVSDLKIRTKNLSDNDWRKIGRANEQLHRGKIHICDKSGVTVYEMLSMCRKLKRKSGSLDLVIIDYLQLIKGEGHGRTEQITNISIALKGMAKELGCPVIVLSQLSRACEQRQNKRPMLSDLRESGQIEQDADIVMFLYRDEYYDPDTEDKGLAEVIFGKQRNGPTGTVKLGYLNAITTFVDMKKLHRG